jgi:oligopeptide/dipeptide ABC transporter ATP-binding protein
MLLEVEHLRIAFRRDGKEVVPVRDVSFSVPEHGRMALVGESGCGKSLTALSLAGLPPTDRATLGGTIRFTGSGSSRPSVAYVFQNPTESLNPVIRIRDQIREALPKGMSRKEGDARIVELLARTGLPDPQRAAHSYPCELSGGQQQRAMIAMALAARPDLLVADEPTTALDVTTQREVLELIDSLANETGMAVLLITHNLGLVAGRMDTVNVMYAGMIVESGPVVEVLSNPRHPYTQGLLAAVPALDAPRDAPLADIPGTVPPPDAWPPGCAFAPRCSRATERCSKGIPPVKRHGMCGISCFEVD